MNNLNELLIEALNNYATRANIAIDAALLEPSLGYIERLLLISQHKALFNQLLLTKQPSPALKQTIKKHGHLPYLLDLAKETDDDKQISIEHLNPDDAEQLICETSYYSLQKSLKKYANDEDKTQSLLNWLSQMGFRRRLPYYRSFDYYCYYYDPESMALCQKINWLAQSQFINRKNDYLLRLISECWANFNRPSSTGIFQDILWTQANPENRQLVKGLNEFTQMLLDLSQLPANQIKDTDTSTLENKAASLEKFLDQHYWITQDHMNVLYIASGLCAALFLISIALLFGALSLSSPCGVITAPAFFFCLYSAISIIIPIITLFITYRNPEIGTQVLTPPLSSETKKLIDSIKANAEEKPGVDLIPKFSFFSCFKSVFSNDDDLSGKITAQALAST